MTQPLIGILYAYLLKYNATAAAFPQLKRYLI
jgi:hypothetical protein